MPPQNPDPFASAWNMMNPQYPPAYGAGSMPGYPPAVYPSYGGGSSTQSPQTPPGGYQWPPAQPMTSQSPMVQPLAPSALHHQQAASRFGGAGAGIKSEPGLAYPSAATGAWPGIDPATAQAHLYGGHNPAAVAAAANMYNMPASYYGAAGGGSGAPGAGSSYPGATGQHQNYYGS